jgi:Leucine-rich repeat (LRR) protein
VTGCVQGEIFDCVSALVGLQSLVLSHNRLKGPLHSWLGALTGLRLLDVSHNGLGGILPEGLFCCTELRVLRANDNCIEGSLPECMSHLTLLEELDLARNKLVRTSLHLSLFKKDTCEYRVLVKPGCTSLDAIQCYVRICRWVRCPARCTAW